MRSIPIYLALILGLALCSPENAQACVGNGALDNLGVYLVGKNPRMKKLCNYCLDEALLPASAIESYNPKTGAIVLTKTGQASLDKAIKQFGGKSKVIGRRFALVAQGRIAFTGDIVSSIMSRAISGPCINIDEKSVTIHRSYPAGMPGAKPLPTPANVKRAVMFQTMTEQLRGKLLAELKESSFKESEFKAMVKIAESSTDASLYQFAPIALTTLKKRFLGFDKLLSWTKTGRDPQQKLNSALALAALRNGLYHEQTAILRACLQNALNSSGNQIFLEEAALALALGNDVKSVKLLSKVQAQYKSPKMAMALRYLKSDSSKSGPFGFGGK